MQQKFGGELCILRRGHHHHHQRTHARRAAAGQQAAVEWRVEEQQASLLPGGGQLSRSAHRRREERETALSHSCQMGIARFLDCMCLALQASGLWLHYATLQNLIPSFPWIAVAPPRPPPWRNPRKRRDQILPSGNLGPRHRSWA